LFIRTVCGHKAIGIWYKAVMKPS